MCKDTISRVLIITKGDRGDAFSLGKEIGKWLEERGIEYRLFSNSHIPEIGEKGFYPDLIMVLGGDGTLLFVIRKYVKEHIPFLGVNFGRVGFLTDIEPERWKDSLREIVGGDAKVCERLLLEWSVIREDREVYQGCSVNDVVISRGHLARLIGLSVEIEREEAFFFRADGVIIATPSGSTGYCSASGGATIFPSLNVIEVCPICPFMTRVVPLILPSNIELRIVVDRSSPEASLTIDGQEGFSLLEGDMIKIKRSSTPIRFFIPSTSSYIRKLKHKGYL